jgi:hypothetical protein
MNKNKLNLAIALAMLTTTTFAEVEITGKITYEGAAFTGSGQTIGDFGSSSITGSGATGNYMGVSTTTTPSHSSRDVLKSEVNARFYIDGEVGEESTWHAEIQGIVGGDTNDSYTQNEVLREAYIDTSIKDWSIRAGKQQVVWGTADGIKLLDMINPTDYTEMAQNSPEDSRIPTWMINAETELENGGNLQFIVSQSRENIFAGLNRNIDTSVRANNMFLDDTTLNNGTDTGHPFMMKGVDSITGVRNGFLNITPDLGSVATRFAMAFTSDAITGVGAGYNGNLATQSNLNTSAMSGFTVDGFEAMRMDEMNGALVGAGPTSATGNDETVGNNFANITEGFERAIFQVAKALNNTTSPTVAQLNAVTGAQMLAYGFAPLYNTNLANETAEKDTAFDYMGQTTFRTFDAFANAKSQYAFDMPKDTDLDVAFRFKNSTENGLNYSVNASYNYDKNPIINLSWRGDNGQELALHEFVESGNTSLQVYDPSIVTPGAGAISTATGAVYGGASGKAATLKFNQTVERVKQIGGSFDYGLDTDSLGPVVLRGEVLYTKDSYQPVMSIDRLAIGDLVGALQMKKADRFKYVLGADFTFLTNMLVSAQFIQDRNLDHIDDSSGYTTDYATMHLSNGFNKAEKNKEFYSLFISKPFGSSDEHRVNNIFMFEENGGKWNRFDVEYSINDEMLATFEWNKYFGDENTQFGQLKNSSNIQLGFKYSF